VFAAVQGAAPPRRLSRRADGAIFILLFAAALFLYVTTLAPTVLWGDDAYFQRAAYTGALRADGGGHWLWLQAARLLLRFTSGDVAYRVNLLSALAAAGTVAVLYMAARAAALRRDSSVVVALALAVSHTFWLHAVRAEVYTVFTLLLALYVWLWFRWQPAVAWPAYTAAAGFGLLLLGHQMALLLLPAWAVLLWRHRHWLARRQWLRFFLLWLLGLLPFFFVLDAQIMRVSDLPMATALRLYFTHADADFSGALFSFAAAVQPATVTLGIALLGLQFVGLSGILGLLGMIRRWRDGWPGPWLALFVFFLTDSLFALSYDVNDRFVFFLPAYLVFALFAGAGWQALFVRREGTRGRALAAALVLLLPILTYAALPSLLQRSGFDPLGTRALPGRDAVRFFLWPPKQEAWGAATFAHEAFALMPPDAVVIADHTPLEPLRYLQTVVGLRSDVTLLKIEPGQDLAPLLSSLPPATAVFLADDNPDYYAWQALPAVRLEPVGPLYRVLRSE
jgi:hypothetical protein